MATVPTPYDAVAGTKLTAVGLDAGLKDPLTWLLTDFPKVHAYDNTGLTLPDNTDTLLTFSGELYDNDNMHSTSSLTSRIVFNTTGYYQTFVNVQLPAATYTGVNIRGRINSAENVAGGTQLRNWLYTNVRMPQMTFTKFFNAGDYIQFWALQVSGGSRSLVLGTTPDEIYGTFVESRWISN